MSHAYGNATLGSFGLVIWGAWLGVGMYGVDLQREGGIEESNQVLLKLMSKGDDSACDRHRA